MYGPLVCIMTTGWAAFGLVLLALLGRASMFRTGGGFDTRCRGQAVQHQAVSSTLSQGWWRLSSTLDNSLTSQSSRAELKGELLKSVAGINRGFSCREEEQKEIFALIEQLEAQNPNAAPNDGFADGSSLLTGEWKLIFTSALDVLSLGLIPGVDVGQVFQNINEDGTEIVNIVDLQPGSSPLFERFAGETSARLKVNAAATAESEKRISLKFRSSQYLPQTLLGWDVSNTFPPLTINLPQLPGAGWVDTTYVDQDIRVARAFGGNLFVLARV